MPERAESCKLGPAGTARVADRGQSCARVLAAAAVYSRQRHTRRAPRIEWAETRARAAVWVYSRRGRPRVCPKPATENRCIGSCLGTDPEIARHRDRDALDRAPEGTADGHEPPAVRGPMLDDHAVCRHPHT